jgi:pSer/pThr/pTyr-binding forkhead associated (FHA) protein
MQGMETNTTNESETNLPKTPETEEAIPENAFLIIEGLKVHPLREPIINIGRRLGNHVIIDDPRISRQHAQLRAIHGHFVLFDLNSTGGTFVNGQRTKQSVLYPNDVISLAGVTLVFGQDLQRADRVETSPLGESGSAARATATMEKSTLDVKPDSRVARTHGDSNTLEGSTNKIK